MEVLGKKVSFVSSTGRRVPKICKRSKVPGRPLIPMRDFPLCGDTHSFPQPHIGNHSTLLVRKTHTRNLFELSLVRYRRGNDHHQDSLHSQTPEHKRCSVPPGSAQEGARASWRKGMQRRKPVFASTSHPVLDRFMFRGGLVCFLFVFV